METTVNLINGITEKIISCSFKVLNVLGIGFTSKQPEWHCALLLNFRTPQLAIKRYAHPNLAKERQVSRVYLCKYVCTV